MQIPLDLPAIAPFHLLSLTALANQGVLHSASLKYAMPCHPPSCSQPPPVDQAFERWSQRAGGIVFSTARNSFSHGSPLRGGQSGSQQQQTCGTVGWKICLRNNTWKRCWTKHRIKHWTFDQGEQPMGMKTVLWLAILINEQQSKDIPKHSRSSYPFNWYVV